VVVVRLIFAGMFFMAVLVASVVIVPGVFFVGLAPVIVTVGVPASWGHRQHASQYKQRDSLHGVPFVSGHNSVPARPSRVAAAS